MTDRTPATVPVPVLRDALTLELGWTEQEIDEFMAELLGSV